MLNVPQAPSMGMTGTTQRYLRYTLERNNDTGIITDYVDLAADLSLVNSRLYKQGREYFVKSIRFLSKNTPSAGIEVNTAPCTWSTFSAYRKARALWNKMNRMALADGGLSKKYLPKWHDFKIYLDSGMRSTNRLIPRDGAGVLSQTADAEWIYSKYITNHDNVEDEFESHLLGDHIGAAPFRTSVGIIHGFEETRVEPDLDTPDLGSEFNTSWMTNLFAADDNVEDILDNLDTDNDRPPYDATDIVGASNLVNPHTIGWVALHATQMTGTLGAFCAPFGLLEIQHSSTNPNDDIAMIIELAPGPYKGIKALGI